MFIGHYGPALAIKRQLPEVPLWLLFVAVQWVDLLFFSFLMLDVEHARLTPGFTESNAYDLYDMPYSHSMATSLIWAGIFAVIATRIIKPARSHRRLVTAALGLAVFSHFLLDVVVHVPDLQLAPGAHTRIGLGLWNYRILACIIESVIWGWGLRLVGWRHKRLQLLAGAGLLLIWLAPWVPAPPYLWAWAIEALALYAALAVGARWTEAAAA